MEAITGLPEPGVGSRCNSVRFVNDWKQLGKDVNRPSERTVRDCNVVGKVQSQVSFT